MQITKLGCWGNVAANRHSLNVGMNSEPFGMLVLDIPVDGVEPTKPLTPDQAQVALQQLLEIAFPTFQVFVDKGKRDFQPQQKDF